MSWLWLKISIPSILSNVLYSFIWTLLATDPKVPLGNDQHSRKPILEHYRISDRNTEYQLVLLPSRSKILASCPWSVVCLYCLILVRGRLAAWASSHLASEYLSEGLSGVKVPSGWGQVVFLPSPRTGLPWDLLMMPPGKEKRKYGVGVGWSRKGVL